MLFLASYFVFSQLCCYRGLTLTDISNEWENFFNFFSSSVFYLNVYVIFILLPWLFSSLCSEVFILPLPPKGAEIVWVHYICLLGKFWSVATLSIAWLSILEIMFKWLIQIKWRTWIHSKSRTKILELGRFAFTFFSIISLYMFYLLLVCFSPNISWEPNCSKSASCGLWICARGLISMEQC